MCAAGVVPVQHIIIIVCVWCAIDSNHDLYAECISIGYRSIFEMFSFYKLVLYYVPKFLRLICYII